MSSNPTRTVVVTGASSGIGKATAAAFAAQGHKVIGTSRNPDSVPAADRVPGVDYRALDLTDPASIERFTTELGAVDVLINNAGESQAGPLAELPGDAVERLFRLNVFGPVALTQAVLPGMRERGYGRVVMVGSMIGSFPIPYRSSYAATKAALRAFATAARFEESPFGVWLTTVEPGQIDTGLSERRTKYLADASPHTADFTKLMAALDSKMGKGIAPEQVAKTIVAAVDSPRPRPLYAIGSNAPLMFAIRRLLPRTVMEKLIASSHGLKR
ncbi:SDR family NAD(P)-dependent oxidoreductase [Nocardia yunnanensis]|uniref:SDR family NAD(P)-dependent oxidoreductase n=1 Tax=Nocardia yunnanensis TaxID=2382165 RepID=A0A386ZPN7_9NOCA|nr:SDR family NAD(P)-dependent oxidoreductase [Nocardia yunnanensis]AYF78525.1 SDR family NAD(P)-dependent oxidoreductase [Nocardia yunnanensis]